MPPALQPQLQLIIMPPICLSGRHLKWSLLSLSQHRCKAGNSGEHSCAAWLANDGNCSCLTEFNDIKAQQEMEITASGRGSPGVVISVSASSGCKGTLLMNVCFSMWHFLLIVYFFLNKNKEQRALNAECKNEQWQDSSIEQYMCSPLTTNLKKHNSGWQAKASQWASSSLGMCIGEAIQTKGGNQVKHYVEENRRQVGWMLWFDIVYQRQVCIISH